jgi:serine/threonine-protein kinase
VRVVLAEDEGLLREGLARLLSEAGFEVIGKAADAAGLLRLVDARLPDVVLTDIRMPPGHSDEGLVAAEQIRERHPEIGVLVLSHHVDSRYAMRMLESFPRRSGYLLKERVSEMAVLSDALRRIGEGECVVDPTIVSRLVARKRARGPLDELTERERQVLALIAEGLSNAAIGERMYLSPKTVEAHISQIFMKLNLRPAADQHRRVLAVLAYLRAS